MEFLVHDPQVAFEEGSLDGGTEAEVEVGRGQGGGVKGSVMAKIGHESLSLLTEASEGLQDERDKGRVFLAGHGSVAGGFLGGVVLGSSE